MSLKVFTKQPADHLDYDIDLTEWLPETDHVQSVSVTSPAGIELVSHVVQGLIVKLWIRGGTDGQTYKFTVLINTITRVKEVDFLMVVTDY